MNTLRLMMFGLLAISVIASAHTRLSSSVPADNAAVSAPPDTIQLAFSTEVRLTALSLADAAGTSYDLGALPTEAKREFAIAAPALPPGRYSIGWRAVGADTHVVSGELHFSVETG